MLPTALGAKEPQNQKKYLEPTGASNKGPMDEKSKLVIYLGPASLPTGASYKDPRDGKSFPPVPISFPCYNFEEWDSERRPTQPLDPL